MEIWFFWERSALIWGERTKGLCVYPGSDSVINCGLHTLHVCVLGRDEMDWAVLGVVPLVMGGLGVVRE
jgi:hypothetical protein